MAEIAEEIVVVKISRLTRTGLAVQSITTDEEVINLIENAVRNGLLEGNKIDIGCIVEAEALRDEENEG